MIDYSQILRKSKKVIFPEQERSFYRGKTVLVTGGGGSVGSVLVRELAALSASSVVIFDIYENNAFELCRELCEQYSGTVSICVEIGSVGDRGRMNAVFEKYKPDVVFHAAAHKHVSLMEENCAEAVKNNCIGTEICAELAEKHGCGRFVLVSTDKAVRPTGVMGASKRVCEMLVLQKKSTATVFCAVRFGNVFASCGSVVPIFKRQIENGGPVTVTDRRVTRFFISLSDAASLLLCAGAMARNGELFVLDMGEPYRIYDIALEMIRLSGKSGIEIIETGLKPGEKLYEEYLLCDGGRCSKTANDMIFVEKSGDCSKYSSEEIIAKLRAVLESEKSETDNRIIKNVLADIVPDYRANI